MNLKVGEKIKITEEYILRKCPRIKDVVLEVKEIGADGLIILENENAHLEIKAYQEGAGEFEFEKVEEPKEETTTITKSDLDKAFEDITKDFKDKEQADGIATGLFTIMGKIIIVKLKKILFDERKR